MTVYKPVASADPSAPNPSRKRRRLIRAFRFTDLPQAPNVGRIVAHLVHTRFKRGPDRGDVARVAVPADLRKAARAGLLDQRHGHRRAQTLPPVRVQGFDTHFAALRVAEVEGVCEKIPDPGTVMCGMYAGPYCNCDGETRYTNSTCVYERVKNWGECQPASCMTNDDCDAGEYCEAAGCEEETAR